MFVIYPNKYILLDLKVIDHKSKSGAIMHSTGVKVLVCVTLIILAGCIGWFVDAFLIMPE